MLLLIEWESAAVVGAAHTALRGLLAAAHTAEAAHTAAVDEAFHGDGGAGAARGDGIGTALCLMSIWSMMRVPQKKTFFGP